MKMDQGYFGGGNALCQQPKNRIGGLWGPVLRASLLSAYLCRYYGPAEKRAEEQQGKRSGANHRGTARILHLPSKLYLLVGQVRNVCLLSCVWFGNLNLGRYYPAAEKEASAGPGPVQLSQARAQAAQL